MAPLAYFLGISIHALREEGDTHVSFPCFHARLFLSTPSARRATAVLHKVERVVGLISIHALREEGDKSASALEPPE